MKFGKLLKYSSDLKGVCIKDILPSRGELVIVTEDSKFAILSPAIDDEDGVYEEYVSFLNVGPAFARIRDRSDVREFLKRHDTFNYDEFMDDLKAQQKEQDRVRELKKIEQEKRLLAELKAKYEGTDK